MKQIGYQFILNIYFISDTPSYSTIAVGKSQISVAYAENNT